MYPAVARENLYERGQVVQASDGTALRIDQPLPPEAVTYQRPAAGSEGELAANLQLVRGIGPHREQGLHGKGFRDLEGLRGHGRWAAQAQRILQAVRNRDLLQLRRHGARDADLLRMLAPEDLLLLDLETTGLSAVQPLFLVGLLYWNPEGPLLRQYLARGFLEETAVLQLVAGELGHRRALVTYNGNSFDIPYFRARCRVQGVAMGLQHLSIDLLHHARRRFRGVLPDCRLVTVESHVTGVRRIGDVPGYEIPERYVQFTRTGNPEYIEDVLYHNACDLVTLARLLALV